MQETTPAPYSLGQNDPFDKAADFQLIVPRLISSGEYMRSIRAFEVPRGALAIWFLGQNGFVLRSHQGPSIAIDPYLSDSCKTKHGHLPFRLDRQLPVFIE